MGKRAAVALFVCGLLFSGCAAPPGATAVHSRRVSPSLQAQDTLDSLSVLPALLLPPNLPVPPEDQPAAAVDIIAPAPRHVDIHGLYMTGWTAGSSHFYELVDYMKRSGLNAVVIDAQDDDGTTSWETNIPLAMEIGANGGKIADIDSRVQYLHDNGIYAIARIVVYADPLLGAKRPDVAILGGKFVDSRGIRWPDPYNQQVWAYKVDIARDAAGRGFDEVQFDYIRFPEHRIQGYNSGVPVSQRVDAISGFLRYAKAQLKPAGVFVSADVFGLTTSVDEGDDMEIGQDYAQIAAVADYVLPMVYPSHFAPGTYGIANPNAEPGEIVYQAMVRAQQRTPAIAVKVHRPWIQDFSLGKRYLASDVEAQIRGLARAGIYQWVLWDPNNVYTRTVDYSVGGGFTGPPGYWQEVRE